MAGTKTVTHRNQTLLTVLSMDFALFHLTGGSQTGCIHLTVHLFQIITIEPETTATGAFVSHDILDRLEVMSPHDYILTGRTGIASGLIQARTGSSLDLKTLAKSGGGTITFLQF